MEQMARQIAQESLRLNDMAMMKSFELIVKALKTQRNYKNPEGEMRGILMNMQGQHLEERKRDVHKIHHTIYVISDKGVGRVRIIEINILFSQQRSKRSRNKNKNLRKTRT